MRLSSFLVVTFGVGVLSYPAFHLPDGKPFFAKSIQQAEPAPKPEPRPRIDYGLVPEKIIDQRDIKLVVNIPATTLSVLQGGEIVKEYKVAVGQAIYKTPVGKQEIKELIWNPWWHPPDSEWAKDEKVTPPGPRNPLGPVKMLLGDEIRMHGTTKDRSIGSAASHGCIRMHSPEARELAWFLQQNLTDKSDPSYLEKYKKNGSTSFYVKLDRPVEVNIVYDPVAFVDDTVIIYPDVYGKIKNLTADISWEMYINGVAPWEFDVKKIKPGKKAQIIPIEELK